MNAYRPQGTGDPATAIVAREPERLIMGRSARTSNAIEFNATPGDSPIARLWADFATGTLDELIPDRHDSREIVMTYSDFENGAEAGYTCTLGFRVRSFDGVPEELSTCVMPAQTCAVIPVGGNPAETIPATWMRILQSFTPGYHLARSFKCDADVFIGQSATEMTARILIGIDPGEPLPGP